MASLTLYNNCENLMNSSLNNYMISNDKMMLHHHRTLASPEHSPQRIAPKLPNENLHLYSNNNSHHQQQNPDLIRCKRRIQLGHLPSSSRSTGPQPSAVARRNERERKRVKLVNEGFNTLRKHVPHSSKNKKMSKVDTLRSAVEYIKRLKELLGEPNSEGSTSQGLDENSYPVGGQSSTGSPTPSMCSEASSPYEFLQGDEDEEFMEFASWY